MPPSITYRRGPALPVFGAAAAGILLWQCFPPTNLETLAWVALMPLLLAMENRSLGAAFLLGCLSAWISSTGVFAWIWSVPAFNFWDYLLLAIWFALPGGAFGGALCYLRRRLSLPYAALAPPIWVSLEYLRSHAGFLSSPWMLLGHSQYRHPAVIQIATLTGVYGVSFMILLVNSALADALLALRRRPAEPPREWCPIAKPLLPLTFAILVPLGSVGFGHVALDDRPALRHLRVAVVQGNIEQSRKWDRRFRDVTLERYERLTRVATRSGPSLIIWPETAVPGDVQHEDDLRRRVSRLAAESGAPLLVGSAARAKFSDRKLMGNSYNSLVLFGPDGRIAGEYRKMVLVPFGEYAPLRGLVEWPKAVASPRANVLPGDTAALLVPGGIPVGATICWENIFPDHVREFVRQGALMLVNATNEAWFGDSAAPHQFLSMNVFRAVENRRAIARAANTGISAFIDPYGRIIGRVQENGKDVGVAGSLTMDLPLVSTQTPYTRYGDLFAWLVVLSTAGLLSLALFRDHRGWFILSPQPVGAPPWEKERPDVLPAGHHLPVRAAEWRTTPTQEPSVRIPPLS